MYADREETVWDTAFPTDWKLQTGVLTKFHERAIHLSCIARALASRKTMDSDDEQERRKRAHDTIEECTKARIILQTLLEHASCTLFAARDARTQPGVSVAYLILTISALLTNSLATLGYFDCILERRYSELVDMGGGEFVSRHTEECLRVNGGLCDGTCKAVSGERHFRHRRAPPVVCVTDANIGSYTVSQVVHAWIQLSAGWSDVWEEDYKGLLAYRDALLVQSEILATSSVSLEEYPCGGPFDASMGTLEVCEIQSDYVRVIRGEESIAASPRFLAEVCVYAFLECCPYDLNGGGLKGRIQPFPSALCIDYAWKRIRSENDQLFPPPSDTFLPTHQNRDACYLAMIMDRWIDCVEEEWRGSATEEGTKLYLNTLFEAKYDCPSMRNLFELKTRKLKFFTGHDCEDEFKSVSSRQYLRSILINSPLRKLCTEASMNALEGTQYVAAISFMARHYFASNNAAVPTDLHFVGSDSVLGDTNTNTERGARKLLYRPDMTAEYVDTRELIGKKRDRVLNRSYGEDSPMEIDSECDYSDSDTDTNRHREAYVPETWINPVVLSDPVKLAIYPITTDTVLVKFGQSTLYKCPSMSHAIVLGICKILNDYTALNDRDIKNKTGTGNVHPLSNNRMFTSFAHIFIEETFSKTMESIKTNPTRSM